MLFFKSKRLFSRFTLDTSMFCNINRSICSRSFFFVSVSCFPSSFKHSFHSFDVGTHFESRFQNQPRGCNKNVKDLAHQMRRLNSTSFQLSRHQCKSTPRIYKDISLDCFDAASNDCVKTLDIKSIYLTPTSS